MANQTPTRTPQRDAVYDVVDGEREYQEKHHPASPAPTHFEIAALIDEYAAKLGGLFESDHDDEFDPEFDYESFLKRLRQIAALAIKGMENHGAAPRENHVPTSAGIVGEIHIVGKGDKL